MEVSDLPLLCMLLHGPATLQEIIIIMHQCFEIHLRTFGRCMWRGEGRRVSVAEWLFCVFGFVFRDHCGKSESPVLELCWRGNSKKMFQNMHMG